MRNTPSSMRWCRTPRTAPCCAAGVSNCMRASPRRWRAGFPRLPPLIPQSWRSIARGRSQREGGGLSVESWPAGSRSLGHGGSCDAVAEGACIAHYHGIRSRAPAAELELHVSLIPALIGTKGYSSSDVGETITLAYASAEQLNSTGVFSSHSCMGGGSFNLVRRGVQFCLVAS